MPNTYTQLHVHYVFAVKGRQKLIKENIRIPLEKYMTGIIQKYGHKLLAIYCMPDHCHVFLGLQPNQSVSDLARLMKTNSSKWLNSQKKLRIKFSWQEGFGAFSYAKSQKDQVIRYILNQPFHHQKKTFQEEYLDFLRKFEVDYDEKYVF
ncbi:MAG: IS200/IS605 family transposase [Bacteroidota bacterium]